MPNTNSEKAVKFLPYKTCIFNGKNKLSLCSLWKYFYYFFQNFLFLIPPKKSKKHYFNSFSQIKQVLFAVRQGYLPKTVFVKIASNTGGGGVYFSPPAGRLRSFQGFCLYRNLAGIYKNYLAEYIIRVEV